MSFTLRWHVPNFVTGDGADNLAAERYSLLTQEELLALPRMREIASEPGFKGWELSRQTYGRGSLPDHLMSTFDDGTFYVVGYVSPGAPLDFPDWTYEKHRGKQ